MKSANEELNIESGESRIEQSASMEAASVECQNLKEKNTTKEQLRDQGKENQIKDQKLCHKCNKSLAKSSHLINIAGQTNRWHPECFKCNVCCQPLDKATTCYIYKDNIVCRDDYFRLQQDISTKCSRCRWPIGASDWVRKAGDFVYHLACFSCDICLRQLSTGEQFTVNIQEKNIVRLLCRLHFAIEPPENSNTLVNTTQMENSSSLSTAEQFDFAYRHHCAPVDMTEKFAQAHSQPQQQQQLDQQQRYLHLLASTSQSNLLLDGKSEHDDMNTEESQLNGSQQHHGGASTSSSAGSSSALISGLPSKSKRVRTTFTEDQLSILQTHFQIDSNPDGQDLERIATITGLSKRVTQVWFQNSRARQKKYMIKRKPSSSSTTTLVTASLGLSSNQFGSGSSNQHHNQSRQLPQEAAMNDSQEEGSHGGDSYRQRWSNVSDRSEISIAVDDIEDDTSRASTNSSSSTSSSSSSSSAPGQLIVSDNNSND